MKSKQEDLSKAGKLSPRSWCLDMNCHAFFQVSILCLALFQHPFPTAPRLLMHGVIEKRVRSGLARKFQHGDGGLPQDSGQLEQERGQNGQGFFWDQQLWAIRSTIISRGKGWHSMTFSVELVNVRWNKSTPSPSLMTCHRDLHRSFVSIPQFPLVCVFH